MKLITINIEGDRHLNRVLPFLQQESPDVVCLQEVFEDTASKIALQGYVFSFLPMTIRENTETGRAMGVAVLVRSTVPSTFHSLYYHTIPGELRQFNREHQEDTVRRGVVFASATFEGAEYRIGTTHFTWTPDGEHASPAQIAHMDSLTAYMTKEPPHVLCGDFNIPRGHNPLYANLTTLYTDAIPPSVQSSLDRTFHRLANDPAKANVFNSFMVDYIFSRPPYRVTDTRLVFGISDHAAVVGTVEA